MTLENKEPCDVVLVLSNGNGRFAQLVPPGAWYTSPEGWTVLATIKLHGTIRAEVVDPESLRGGK